MEDPPQLADLKATLQEGKQFLAQATQPRLKRALFDFVTVMEREVATAVITTASNRALSSASSTKNGTSSSNGEKSATAQQQQATTSAPAVPTTTSISTYSWDENDTDIKLYFKAPSVLFDSREEKKRSCIRKVMLFVRSLCEEKLLEIKFMIASSSSSSSSTSGNIAGGGDDTSSGGEEAMKTEAFSLLLHPVKQELEQVAATFELLPAPIAGSSSSSSSSSSASAPAAAAAPGSSEKQQTEDESSCPSPAYYFQTPNASFVHPLDLMTNNTKPTQSCRIKVKPTGDVVFTIKKLLPAMWGTDIIDKDDFGKPLAVVGPNERQRKAREAAGDGDDDGSSSANKKQQTASMVSLMQQLYRDGDDEMRKTIAEAWEESKHLPQEKRMIDGKEYTF